MQCPLREKEVTKQKKEGAYLRKKDQLVHISSPMDRSDVTVRQGKQKKTGESWKRGQWESAGGHWKLLVPDDWGIWNLILTCRR